MGVSGTYIGANAQIGPQVIATSNLQSGVGAGDLVLIATIAISNQATAAFTVTGYKRYVVQGSVQAASGTPSLIMHLNGDTGTNYGYQTQLAVGSTLSGAISSGTTSALLVQDITSNASETSTVEVMICDNSAQTAYATYQSFGGTRNNSAESVTGYWVNAAALTTITLLLSSGNMTNGTISIYGVVT